MIDSDAFHRARELAVAYIGIDHSKSSGRVRDNLRKKDVDDKIAERVIDYLISIDYIDDRRAARRVARRYQGSSLRSRRAMFYVFLQNGIEREIAEDESKALDDDRNTALELCDAVYAGREEVDDLDMMKLLARRGYHAALVLEVIKEFKKSRSKS